MPDYLELLKDPRWQKKRLEILERDGWGCKWCGGKDKTLHVHHIFYFKDKEPWEVNNGFLVTLCEECHFLREGSGEYSIRDDITQNIGSLLNEIWTSGYNTQDLMSIQEAIYHCKKKINDGLLNDGFIGFRLKAIYLGDHVEEKEI